MKLRNKKGFTIVELVIVIAVIAILAAVLIPTFASLVEKANLSADEQAVRQMNTALAIYAAEHGDPDSVAKVRSALSANGINADTTPVTQGFAYYWDGERQIVLVSTDEVTTKVKDGWAILSSNEFGNKVIAATPTDIKNAIADSKTTGIPALVKLDADITHDDSIVVNTGESLILDLNGKTITRKGSDQTTFDLKDGGSMTVKNGSVVCSGQYMAYCNSGSKFTMSNVTINGAGSIFAVGLTDVTIRDCKINTTYNFGITTNSGAPECDGTRFYIYNTEVKSNHTGIYVGNYADITIENCPKIAGKYFGVFFRGCNVTIKNSNIYNTDSGADGDKDTYTDQFAVSGPAADAVFASGGVDHWTGYITTGNYTCENVTFGQNGKDPQVFVHEPAGGKVNLTGVIPTHICHHGHNVQCDRTHTD